MKQKFYRAEIIKRFMPSGEQADFDQYYEESKVRESGQGVVELTKLGDEEKKSVLELIGKAREALKK